MTTWPNSGDRLVASTLPERNALIRSEDWIRRPLAVEKTAEVNVARLTSDVKRSSEINWEYAVIERIKAIYHARNGSFRFAGTTEPVIAAPDEAEENSEEQE